MAIIKFGNRPFYHNPWHEVDKMRREMDRLANLFERDAGFRTEPPTFPALTLSEDEETIIVRIEMPGVPPAEAEIFLEGTILTIQGERKSPSSGEEVSFHRREIKYGPFSRAISLPTKINPAQVVARAAKGMLTITLPKAPRVEPRRVPVDVG